MLATNLSLINRPNLVKEIKTECALLEEGKNRDSKGSPIHISTTTAKLTTLVRAYNEELAAKKGKKVDAKTCQVLQVERAQVKNLITRVTPLGMKTTSAPSWVKPALYTVAGLAAVTLAAYKFCPCQNSSEPSSHIISVFDTDKQSFFDPNMCPNPLSVNQIPKSIINIPVTGQQSSQSTALSSKPISPKNLFAPVNSKGWGAVKALKARGKAILETFNSMRSASPEFPVDGPDAKAYRQKWLDSEQCPANLNDYVDYQKQKGFAPRFNQDDLKTLFGADSDLTGAQTRNLYHSIINTNRYICSPTNSSCVPKVVPEALRASDLRKQAREYTRIRTDDKANEAFLQKSPWYFRSCASLIGSKKCLELRDWWTYGTSDISDPNYITGKYATAGDEAESSRKIFEAAMRTNKEMDELAASDTLTPSVIPIEMITRGIFLLSFCVGIYLALEKTLAIYSKKIVNQAFNN